MKPGDRVKAKQGRCVPLARPDTVFTVIETDGEQVTVQAEGWQMVRRMDMFEVIP